MLPMLCQGGKWAVREASVTAVDEEEEDMEAMLIPWAFFPSSSTRPMWLCTLAMFAGIFDWMKGVSYEWDCVQGVHGRLRRHWGIGCVRNMEGRVRVFPREVVSMRRTEVCVSQNRWLTTADMWERRVSRGRRFTNFRSAGIENILNSAA